MGRSIFCRDGILRVEVPGEDANGKYEMRRFPAAGGERADVRLSWWCGYPVLLEEGLTVGELFENLAPWADELSDLLDMNFGAFLEEARKKSDTILDDYVHVEIRYSLSLEGVPRHDRSSSHMDGISFLAGAPIKSTDLRVRSEWNSLAIHKNPEESGSLDYVPLNQWAHLPVVIVDTFAFTDRTPKSRYLTIQNGVFDPACELVRDDGHTRSVTALSPAPSFLDAIAHGFLANIGFHITPEARDAAFGTILSRLDGIRDGAPEREQPGPEAVETEPSIPVREHASPFVEEGNEDEASYSEAEISALRDQLRRGTEEARVAAADRGYQIHPRVRDLRKNSEE